MKDGINKIDRVVFIGRELPICVLAIWWVVRQLRLHDFIGAFLLGGVVTTLLTVWNLWASRR